METFLVIVFTVMLYSALGTIVNAFVASSTSSKVLGIKQKVFTYVYAPALLFIFIILISQLGSYQFIHFGFGCGLILGNIIKIMFERKKFLTEIELNENKLIVHYLIPSLKQQRMTFDLAQVSGAEIVKASWLIDYPTQFTFSYDWEFLEFWILDKDLKAEVQNQINLGGLDSGRVWKA